MCDEIYVIHDLCSGLTEWLFVCCEYASQMIYDLLQQKVLIQVGGMVMWWHPTHTHTFPPLHHPPCYWPMKNSVCLVNKWTWTEPTLAVKGSSEFRCFVQFTCHPTQEITPETGLASRCSDANSFSAYCHSLTNQHSSLHSSLLCLLS